MVDRIAVPTPFQVGPVNAYVAGRTVVDPGPESESAREALTDALAERSLAPSGLERVVVTHPHPDHFGLASELRDAGADVLATAAAAEILRDFEGRLDYEQAYFTALFEVHGMEAETAQTVTELPEAFLEYAPSTAVDRELAAGDAVPLGEREATVRELAGHAVGELGLEFATADDAASDGATGGDATAEPERHAIVGDQVLGETTPNPFLQPPDRDDLDAADLGADSADAFRERSPAALDDLRPRVLPAYEASLEELRDASYDRLLPGHGEPIDEPAARIDELRAAHAERTDAVRDLLDGPTTAAEVTRGLFEDLPVVEYFAGMSEALGHLDVLEHRDEVERVAADGGLAYELA